MSWLDLKFVQWLIKFKYKRDQNFTYEDMKTAYKNGYFDGEDDTYSNLEIALTELKIKKETENGR